MEAKCPMCGAPMENGNCGYCGYIEKKVAEPKENIPNTSNTYKASENMQVNQQQVVINNTVVNNTRMVSNVSSKSKMIALLLCIFFGYFGFHKFYVGKIGMGILYLCTLGIFGVGWIVDIILIAIGSFKDKYGLPLKN